MNQKKPHVIKDTWTAFGWFMQSFVYFIIVTMAAVFITPHLIDSNVDFNAEKIVILLFGSYLAFFILGELRVFEMKRLKEKRFVSIARLAAENTAPSMQQAVNRAREFGLMSLTSLAKKTIHFENYFATADWSYCDFLIDVYHQTKNGDYLAYVQHYAVMTTQLPRALPNVMFDSRKNRRRQFRFQYKRDQLHSLEGNFDKFFASYFPPDYTIDSLSFISPDVMHKLIDAADYDIEIVGDRIYMYGTPYEPSLQIPEMSAKLASIKKELLDNILTYRDDRLPVELGRLRVAPQGMYLDKSVFLKRLSMAFTLIAVLLYFGFQVWLRIASEN